MVDVRQVRVALGARSETRRSTKPIAGWVTPTRRGAPVATTTRRRRTSPGAGGTTVRGLPGQVHDRREQHRARRRPTRRHRGVGDAEQRVGRTQAGVSEHVAGEERRRHAGRSPPRPRRPEQRHRTRHVERAAADRRPPPKYSSLRAMRLTIGNTKITSPGRRSPPGSRRSGAPVRTGWTAPGRCRRRRRHLPCHEGRSPPAPCRPSSVTGRPEAASLPDLSRSSGPQQDHEVVAVDDLVGDALGRSAVCAGAASRPAASSRTRPLANTSPSGPAISTASSASKRALDPARRRRAAATRRARAGPGGRRRRRRRCPDEPTAKAIQSLRAGEALRPGAARPCRPRPRRPRRRPARRGGAAPAITARTPDQAAILAAASFEAMPPLPRRLPVPPARASSAWSTSTISSMSDAVGVEPGIGGEQPGRVGEQHQQVGADEVGDQGGEAVVVAEADLVVGDGVVLVDDRAPRRARAGARACARACRYCWRIMKSSGRQQHLAADQAVRGQGARRRPA